MRTAAVLAAALFLSSAAFAQTGDEPRPAQQGASAQAEGRAASGKPASTPEPKLVADFNFVLGEKVLDRDDWTDDLDRQFATGLETTWSGRGWPVRVAADLVFANHQRRRGNFIDETITRGSTAELALGARVVVPIGRFRPYAGAGPQIAQGDIQVLRRGESDSAMGGGGFGWWAGGGVYARLGRTANVGISVRWSTTKVKAGEFEADAGGLLYGVTIGFGIPKYGPDDDDS